MMKLKKFFAAVLAGAVALSSFSLSASAASSETGGGTSDNASAPVKVADLELPEGSSYGDTVNAWDSLWVKTYASVLGTADDLSKYQITITTEPVGGTYDTANNNIAFKIYGGSVKEEAYTVSAGDDDTTMTESFNVSECFTLDEYNGIGFNVQAGHVNVKLVSAVLEEVPSSDDNKDDNVATKVADLELPDGSSFGDTVNAWDSLWVKTYASVLGTADDLSKYQITITTEPVAGTYDTANNNIAFKIYGGSVNEEAYTVSAGDGDTIMTESFNVAECFTLDEYNGIGFNVQAGHLSVKLVSAVLEEVPSKGDDDGDVTTKTLTLTGIDASSWGDPAVTKAAQVNTSLKPTEFKSGIKYGNVKNTTVTFDGIKVKSVTGAGITAEDVEVGLYAKWGSTWIWSSGSADGWDLSQITGVSDSDELREFGYQLTIKGNVGGINDMALADISVPVEIEYVGMTVDGEINNDSFGSGDDTPTEADPSKWQVVLYGFGPDWASNWAGTIGEKGVLTAEATIGDIMEKDGVDQYGGIQVQVWGARENDVASYRILVKGADGKFVKVNTQGTHTFAATDTGLDTALGQFCMPICWGTYSFDPSDVITVVVAEGETVPALPGSGSTGGGVVSGGSSGTSTPTTPSTPDDGKTEVIDPETLPVKFTDGDNNTGAEVAAPEGAFDDGVKFNAVPVAEDTNNEDKFTFDFSFTDKDGKEVQPKAAVTVSVPVPTALIGKTVFVYHIENDGKYTEINCKVEDGKILFTVSGFSKYVITSQKLNANGEPAAEQPGTSDPGTTNPGSTNEPNANTGVGGVAAVLGITAIAAAAMIVSKKRK